MSGNYAIKTLDTNISSRKADHHQHWWHMTKIIFVSIMCLIIWVGVISFSPNHHVWTADGQSLRDKQPHRHSINADQPQTLNQRWRIHVSTRHNLQWSWLRWAAWLCQASLWNQSRLGLQARCRSGWEELPLGKWSAALGAERWHVSAQRQVNPKVWAMQATVSHRSAEKTLNVQSNVI